MDDIENLRGKASRALEQISADREEAQKVRVAYDDLREKMAQSEAQGAGQGGDSGRVSEQALADLRGEWQADLDRVDGLLEQITPLIKD